MDDRIRVSDADRERVTARLRDHFAEGRLTSDELDERVTQTLNAKTYGDLRTVMADLPEPAPPPRPAAAGPQARPPWTARRRPRILPLALAVLLVMLLLGGGPGGWVLFGFLRLLLVFWLATCLIGVFAARRFRRRMHSHWHGYGPPRHRYPWV